MGKSFATLLAVAGLLVGCGGDEALSKQQYVSRLNAMCEDFSAREKEIGEPQGAQRERRLDRA